MARSLAKGSFDVDDLESPTLESLESGDDPHESTSPSNHNNSRVTRMGGFAYDDDDDEGDYDSEVAGSPAVATNTTSSGRSPPKLGAPVSDRSFLSHHSSDQVLDLSSAIDITDNAAILSRYNKQHNHGQQSQQQQQPLEIQEQPQQRTSSPVKVVVNRQTSRVLSRRPSIHETHEMDEDCTQGEFLFYLYSLAIIGTSMRIFIGRLFGQDCENPGSISDFLSPVSEQICVTATGETEQRGGALFVDLPTNILGCFIMGLVSSLSPEHGLPGGKLPWLRKDHPLQQVDGLHHAIKIGLCGSLTTWSSWNAQMVAMMDGTDTELGPQVIPAIFGYIIGMSSAVASFQAGGRCYEWLYTWSNSTRKTSSERWPCSLDDEQEHPTSWDSEDSHYKSRHSASTGSNASPQHRDRYLCYSARQASCKKVCERRPPYISLFLHKILPFLIVVVLLVFYGIADGVMGIQFYKELWACCILTPIGVHLRWKLATFNGRGIGPNHRLDWVPWGTLICNLLASVIAVVFQALRVHYLQNGENGLRYPWVVAIVVAMKTGLAGSLSTVSSMVKEIVVLRTLYPTHAKASFYGCCTILLSMLLGLCVYSPIMRYG